MEHIITISIFGQLWEHMFGPIHNLPVPEDYPGEINRLKGWIKNRFKWLDYTIATSSETNVVKFETSHLDGLNWRFEVGNSLEDIYHWDFGVGIQHQAP